MPYIGQPPVSGDTTKSFRLLDNLASFTLTFDATSSSVVDTTANTLTFANHRFVTAQRVTYTDGGGTAIGGLTDGTAYFVIKVDQNTIQLASSASNANNSTAISLSSGAAGGSHTLNLAFDGTNTKFKATYGNGTKAKISRAGQLLISINGVLQQAQESSSPTLGFGLDSDSTIVFSQAPVSTDVLFGQILADTITNFDTQDNTLDVFTGDGSTTAFTLSKKPASSNDILVTLDGVVQYPTTTSTSNAYSVSDNTLLFTSAPADGVAIQVRHIGFAGATSSAVTGLYGRTGNVTLSSSDDDITVGNVTAGIITATSYGSISGTTASFSGNVSVGGTLTYEDVTNIDSVGLITARSGISITSGDLTLPDSIIHAGDTNTKIRFPAADTFTVETGGTERLRITSAGSVGIGTDTISDNLEVFAPTNASLQIKGGAAGGDASRSAQLKLLASGSKLYVMEADATDGSFRILDSSTERLRIDSSGRLLLGTTTEGVGQSDDLTVATSGDTGITVRSGTSSNGNLFFSDGTSGTDEYRGYVQYDHSANALIFGSDATERMRIDSSGRFFFNETSSDLNHKYILSGNEGSDVAAFQYNSNTGTYLAILTGPPNGIVEIKADARSGSFPPLTFKTGANERMRLDSSGRLLVGTSSVLLDNTSVNIQATASTGSRIALGRNDTTTGADNIIGGITFRGNDSNGTYQECAYIFANAESAHGDNDKPTYLKFATTADGASSSTERMRIDSSGRLLVGKTSTGANNGRFQSASSAGPQIVAQNTGTSSAYALFVNSTTGDAASGDGLYVGLDANQGYLWNYENSNLLFGTNSTERMRIDSSGRLLVGKTIANAAGAGVEIRPVTSGQLIIGKTFSGTVNGIYFNHNTAYVGGLNYSNTGTSLQTSSDYRLKENIVAVPNAIERAKQLNPVRFNFIIEPEKTVEGFIAHELGQVVPEACFGEKDAVNEDGSVKPQTIAQEKIIPLLTAALQEAIAEIETLKTKVAALEG